jgi:hypothetical protein
MWGFQLWVNLPARDKMRPPRYQDIPPERIPEVDAPGGTRLRVVAGEALGTRGPVEGIATEPLYLDVALPDGARFELPLPAGHNACAYVFEGRVAFGDGADGGRSIGRGQLAVLGAGDLVAARAEAGGARLLLLAARPIGEPIARLGPFVMNTRAELEQAVRELRDGTFLG